MRRVKMLPALFRLGVTAILAMQLSPSVVAQGGGERTSSNSRRDGLITGRVIADDGRPLSDVEIMAGAIGGDMFDVRRTETDDEGNFKLTGLKTKSYKIEASLSGYVRLKNATGAQFYRNGDNVTIRMMKGGVITGRVTDARGEPLEMVFVNLLIAHDIEGRDASSNPLLKEVESRDFLTDDRGVYRAYGLTPGKYVISVIDVPIPRFNNGSIPHDSPTYYPSGKREAATEVAVRSGEEVTGVNIIHRGERGYSITGVVSSRFDPISYMSTPAVTLINKSNEELETVTAVTGVFDTSSGSRSFSLHGTPDGEYVLTASSGLSRSAPLNITVKGADVTGLNLRLVKSGSISGRVVVESSKPDEGCGGKSSVEEIFLRVGKVDVTDRNQVNRLTAINQAGDFIQPLEDGVYRIIPDLPGDNWYVRAVARTSKEAPNGTTDLARDGVAVKAGESLTGIEVKVARGAASLRGRVAVTDETQTKEGTRLRWRVYLVPFEETAADDVLRYAETDVQSDASFELKHIAPGKYYLLARKIGEKASIEDQSRLTAWDNVERAKLRSEAQALKQEAELRPCQQMNDYLLRTSANSR